MIGIWSEDDWPLPGDTVKQTNKQKINKWQPQDKENNNSPSPGGGGGTDFKWRGRSSMGQSQNPPKSPWAKNLPPKNPMMDFRALKISRKH